MTRYGYFLSTEEHRPGELVRQARMAEEAGFEALWISDHYHPWLDEQGQASFVWPVIGAVAQAVSLPIGTAVTCPLVRTHPAVIAQATATTAVLTGGRFTLGVGTGEFLNEHVLDSRWPPAAERLAMLEEAVDLMRRLFTGELVTYRGEHYRVDTARLYTRPDDPPPVFMSGFGPKAARVAGRIADGFICMAPDEDLAREFRHSGGEGKPVQGGLKACWAADEAAARATARRVWASDYLPGEANQLLPLPRQFRQLSGLVTEDMVAEQVPCGPDPELHARYLRAYADAGYDDVFVAQIGPEQEGFFDFYAREVLPRLRSA